MYPIYPRHRGTMDVVIDAHKMPQVSIAISCQANTCCTLEDFPCHVAASVLFPVARYEAAYERHAAAWRRARSHARSVCQSPHVYNTTKRLSPCHENVACYDPVRETTGLCDTL